jgi:hypothetical protein
MMTARERLNASIITLLETTVELCWENVLTALRELGIKLETQAYKDVHRAITQTPGANGYDPAKAVAALTGKYTVRRKNGLRYPGRKK